MSVIRCRLCERALRSHLPSLARYASTSPPPRVPPSPTSTKSSSSSRPLQTAPKPASSVSSKQIGRSTSPARPVPTRPPSPPRPASKSRTSPLPPSPPRPPPSIPPKASVQTATAGNSAKSSNEAEDDDIENRSFIQSVQRLTPTQWYLVGGVLAAGAAGVWAMDKFALAHKDEELSTILDRAPDVQRRAS